MGDIVQANKNQNGYFVAKGNQLITDTRYSVTLQQQKELLFLISMIKPTDSPNTMYEFSINEFAKACECTPVNGEYYQTIKNDIQRIAEMSCWIKTGIEGEEEIFRWIDRAVIDLGNGRLGIKFHYTVTEYLFALCGNYTTYELRNALSLSSKYSIRLYEFLKAMLYRHTVIVEVDDLKVRLDANKKKYDRFAQFRERILQPGAFDVNTYTDICVGYQFIKTGRTITHIVFDIEEKATLAQSIATEIEVKRTILPDAGETVVKKCELDQQRLPQLERYKKRK